MLHVGYMIELQADIFIINKKTVSNAPKYLTKMTDDSYQDDHSSHCRKIPRHYPNFS